MKTKKVAFCAVMAAMATVLMLIGYIPYLTYSVPCIAALAVMVAVLEYGLSAGFATYLASLLPVFLLCEPETKLIYILVFGYYPVLKCIYEKIKVRPIEYVLKLLGFNAAVLLVYFLGSKVFGVSYDDLGEIGRYGSLIILVAANAVFVLYDILLEKIATLYFVRFHKTVAKLLGKK